MSSESINEVLRSGDVRNNVAKSDSLVQLVVFTLDDEEYAVPITDLQEIIKVPEVTTIPNAPSFIKGILNLRGKIVVVIDLECRFKLTRKNLVDLKHIIITEVGGTSFGIMVDEVVEVLTVSSAVIQPTPTLISTRIHTDYLNGVVVLESSKKTSNSKKITTNDEVRNKFVKKVLDEGGDIDLLGEKSEVDPVVEKPQVSSTQARESSDSRLLILIDLSKILQEKELIAASETSEQVSTQSNAG